MAAITLTQAHIGKKVSFLTKHDKDSVQWRGTIAGLVNRPVAQQFTDLVSYNAAVRRSDPTVAEDLDDLTLFLIVLDTATTGVATRAFAVEWITDNSFTVLDVERTVTLEVYDAPENDPSTILTLLKANGYRVKLLSVA